jgi:hypothetical protein
MAVIFFDDFTGSTLNPLWNVDTSPSILRNAGIETEWYQASQVALDGNSNLVITALCLDPAGIVSPPYVTYGGNTYTWYSGEISQRTTTPPAFQNGTISFRAKLPNLAGMWPACWANSPTGANEIDVMEVYGESPPTINHVTYTSNYSPLVHQNYSLSTGLDLSAGFHIYRCDWTSSSMAFWVDDQRVGTITAGQENSGATSGVVFPQVTIGPIINLGVAGTNGGGFLTPVSPSVPPGTTVELLVDWVRIEQNNPQIIVPQGGTGWHRLTTA